MVVTTEITVLCEWIPCNLVDVYCFVEPVASIFRVGFSKMWTYVYQSTCHHISEYSYLLISELSIHVYSSTWHHISQYNNLISAPAGKDNLWNLQWGSWQIHCIYLLQEHQSLNWKNWTILTEINKTNFCPRYVSFLYFTELYIILCISQTLME